MSRHNCCNCENAPECGCCNCPVEQEKTVPEKPKPKKTTKSTKARAK